MNPSQGMAVEEWETLGTLGVCGRTTLVRAHVLEAAAAATQGLRLGEGASLGGMCVFLGAVALRGC